MTVWLESVSSGGDGRLLRPRRALRRAGGVLGLGGYRAQPLRVLLLDDDRLLGHLTAHALRRVASRLIVVDLRFERFPTARDVLGLLTPAAHEPERRQQQRRDAQADPQQRRREPADRLRHQRRLGGAGVARDRRGRGDRSGGLLGLGSRLGFVGEQWLRLELDAGIRDLRLGRRAPRPSAAAAVLQVLQLGFADLEQAALFGGGRGEPPQRLGGARRPRRAVHRRVAATGVTAGAGAGARSPLSDGGKSRNCPP